MDPLSIFDTFPTVGNATGTTEIFNHKGFFCRGGLLTHWGLESVGESCWTTRSILGLVTVFSTSGPLFYYYYWPGQVTFEKWQYKSNPKVQRTRRRISLVLAVGGNMYIRRAGQMTQCTQGGRRGWGGTKII